MYIINNYFGKNRAQYHDIVSISDINTNFSRNIFFNNTGTHIVDLAGSLRHSLIHTFYNNYLSENIALGHGY